MEKLTQQIPLVENRVFYQRETLDLGTASYNSFEVILNGNYRYCTGVYFITDMYSACGLKKNNNTILQTMPGWIINSSQTVRFDKNFIPVNIQAAGEKIHVFFDKKTSIHATCDVIFRLENRKNETSKKIKWDYDIISGLNTGVDKSVKLNIHNSVRKITGIYINSYSSTAHFGEADIRLSSYSTVHIDRMNTYFLPNQNTDYIFDRIMPVEITSKDIWLTLTNVVCNPNAGIFFMYTYE